MSRDWKRYKTEIEQLHITEGKPLDDVRRILRARHGFDASNRAYRIRIKNWGLTKHKSMKSEQHPHLAAGNTLIESPTDEDLGFSSPEEKSELEDDFPISTPTFSSPASEILASYKFLDPTSALHNLRKLWSSCPDIGILLQHPDYKQWERRSTPNNAPIIFLIIETVVLSKEERFQLMKDVLVADLKFQQEGDYPYERWRNSWHDLVEKPSEENVPDSELEDWDDTKELLSRSDVITQAAGQVFLDCALIVTAERHLQICHDLKRPRCSHKTRYLYILGDFRYNHLSLKIDPFFYRAALPKLEKLEMFQENIPSLKNWQTFGNYCRQTFVQLTAKKPAPFDPRDMPAPISVPRITAAQSKSEDNSLNIKQEDIDGNDLDFSTTEEVYTTLTTKWLSLSGFNSYVEAIIRTDGHSISIFEPTYLKTPNLFDTIHSSFPPDSRNAFIQSLLISLASVTLSPTYSPSFLLWWTSVYVSSSWDTFTERLDEVRIKEYLSHIMSVPSITMLLNAIVLLVGETLLLSLKTRLVAVKARSSSQSVHPRLCQQYMAILRGFRDRQLVVDQRWISILFNVM